MNSSTFWTSLDVWFLLCSQRLKYGHFFPLQVVAGVVEVSPPGEGVAGSEEEVGGALEVEEGGALEEDVVVEGGGASEEDTKPALKTRTDSITTILHLPLTICFCKISSFANAYTSSLIPYDGLSQDTSQEQQ